MFNKLIKLQNTKTVNMFNKLIKLQNSIVRKYEKK